MYAIALRLRSGRANMGLAEVTSVTVQVTCHVGGMTTDIPGERYYAWVGLVTNVTND